MSLYPLRRLVVPVLLLISAVLLRHKVIELMPVYGQLLNWLPYITLVTGFILCIYYNRSRQLTAILGLLVIYFTIQTQLQTSLDLPEALVIYSMISAAIPVTLFILLILPERGLGNLYGILIVAMAPALLLIATSVLHYIPAATAATFFSNAMPVKPIAGYVLPVNISAFFMAGSLTGLLVLGIRDSEIEASLLAVLLFTFVTLAFFNQAKISTVMFSAAGISLIISLLRSSYDMAYRDDLTGLLGRRALNERLKGLGRRYVIAMMDVDHFKKFNDTYGHDVGDEVLKMVAGQIAAVRGGGTAYRFGGEEFCVVFAGKDLQYCTPFLQAVRLGVEGYRMSLRDSKNRPVLQKKGLERRGRRGASRGGKTVSVTISIGMAERNDHHRMAPEVLKAADTALYRAKKNGRNCLAF